jgi:hypothetical protein
MQAGAPDGDGSLCFLSFLLIGPCLAPMLGSGTNARAAPMSSPSLILGQLDGRTPAPFPTRLLSEGFGLSIASFDHTISAWPGDHFFGVALILVNFSSTHGNQVLPSVEISAVYMSDIRSADRTSVPLI